MEEMLAALSCNLNKQSKISKRPIKIPQWVCPSRFLWLREENISTKEPTTEGARNKCSQTWWFNLLHHLQLWWRLSRSNRSNKNSSNCKIIISRWLRHKRECPYTTAGVLLYGKLWKSSKRLPSMRREAKFIHSRSMRNSKLPRDSKLKGLAPQINRCR